MGNRRKTAQIEAEKRLIQEAELVPCPKCLWINDDLIERYRLAQFRGSGILAICLATAGIAGSLIWALLLYINHPADRGSIPFVIACGTVFAFVSVTLLMMIRRWLRLRIQPNLRHPQPPVLPAGTPPPLVRNGGELIVALPVESLQQIPLDSSSMEFQIGRHAFPNSCCICMENADPQSAISIEPILGISLAIPVCRRCSRQVLFHKLLGGTATAIGAFVPIALVFFTLDSIRPDAWFLLIGAAAGIGAFVGMMYFNPVRAKVINPSRGTLQLFLPNPAFRAHVYESEPEVDQDPDFSFLRQEQLDE